MTSFLTYLIAALGPSRQRRPPAAGQRHARLELDTLERRDVPSGGVVTAPARVLALSGEVDGIWRTRPRLPGGGNVQTLEGAGTVPALGQVQAVGTLHTAGFLAHRKTTGTITLANADTSVTLRLVGRRRSHFTGPPSTFRYTIVGGTGLDAGASGTGTATLTERPEVRPVCPPGTLCPLFLTAASFTMTFQPGP